MTQDRREYYRQYYQANAKAKREYARQYRAEHPDRVQEAKNRWNRANPQPNRDRARRWRQENPERYRKTQAANSRKARQRGYREPRILARDQQIAASWHAQDGKCYLCAEPLLLADAILEHDHRCCPNGSFCQICVRGAAHSDCNAAIGMAGDDPDRLRRMADALEAAQALVTERFASKPIQLEMGA